MKTLITTAIVLLNTVITFSQGVFTMSADTADKMQSYLSMLKNADHYELISEMELQKISFLKVESHRYCDSATVMLKRAATSKKNASVYIRKANRLYDRSNLLLQKADSVLMVASAYKDTASEKSFEAEQYYSQLGEDYRPVTSQDEFRFTTYIVLIGTRNVRAAYLDNARDIKIITTIDGEKKYIIGQFDTQGEAMEYSQNIAQMGYADTFVKSLDQIY